MQLPKLTRPQSRFAASFGASVFLFFIYPTFSNYHLACAADSSSIAHFDHEHLLELRLGLEDTQRSRAEHEEQDSNLLKQGPDVLDAKLEIIERASTPAIRTLSNNDPGVDSIAPGETHYWVFPASSLSASRASPTQTLPSSQLLFDTSAEPGGNDPGSGRPELKKRQQGEVWLYTTLSICGQPSSRDSNPKDMQNPLILYTSQSEANRYPGPNVNQQQGKYTSDEGFVNYTYSTSGDTYLGVYAPPNPGFSGNFSYQLTSSMEEPYTYSYSFQGLRLMDSDRNSSVLVTSNLTAPDAGVQEWIRTGGPFDIFVHDAADVAIKGLLRSFCGLNKTAQIRDRSKIESGMTTVADGLAKQQFYISGLNKSTVYYAVMALKSKYTQSGPTNVGGGGMLWEPFNFTTKSDDNCQLIYNLSFCDTVSYAVPANPNKYPSMSSLASFYDNFTSSAFANFNKSLEQIPCNTSSVAQWSLAANCSTCMGAYRNWLCAVTIPRCADYSSTETYLQPRAINQSFINGSSPSTEFGDLTFSIANKSAMFMTSSRDPRIDTTIEPGPYKELLPCIGLCYGIVQNCPAVLGFGCPLTGKGQEHSYGYATNGSFLTCNMPGASPGTNSAPGRGLSSTALWTVVSVTVGLGIMSI